MPNAAPTDDPSLVPPPVTLTPGAEYAPAQRLFQGIPGIERTADGTLWATWYTGSHTETPQNHVVLARSGDDGRTWADPVLVVDPPDQTRAFDPAVWCDPRGRLWLFWAQTDGMWDGRAGVWAIRNDTPAHDPSTWSTPRRLADGIMLNKPTVLSDGTWLMPASVWDREPRRPDMDARRHANAVASSDAGDTWEWRGGADMPDRIFDEHHIIERRDGALWLVARTLDGVGESTSHDGGRTWSPGRQSGIPCPNSRFFMGRLRSGRLLMVNHVGYVKDPEAGFWGGRNHLTAQLSDDDGRTWHDGLLLDERHAVSYPDAVEGDDGLIYVIYDRNRTTDREILLAVCTEQDILAGRAADPRSRLRQLVSKGTGKAE
jgi:predicted neuraminidase